MSSILDIDLDYFNLVSTPLRRLNALLAWGKRPVDLVADDHATAFRCWRRLVAAGRLAPPEHLLHVDEHHDLMDQRRTVNPANVMYHVLTRWPSCRVYWLAECPIDTPAMWLDADVWRRLRRRFQVSTRRPRRWPPPDFVSVTVSPDFVRPELAAALLAEVRRWGIREPG